MLARRSWIIPRKVAFRLSSEGTVHIDGSHQTTINSMVEHLIARRGFDSVIGQLVAAVYNLGEISLADPENPAKLRDFDMWALAVRAAILKHDLTASFESRLTPFDRIWAAELKVRLD